MKETELSARQINALLSQLGVKDAKSYVTLSVKREPVDLRVASDQRDWDWLEKAPKNDVKKLIWRRELDKAEQLILVLRGDHELIMTYLAERVFTSDKALIELAHHRIHSEIVAATKRAALPDEAMVYLIENGFKETRDYLLKRSVISTAAEIALVKRGRHRDIMLYTKRWPMFPTAAKELIIRGNHDEIMACIKHKNAMFGENLRLLIERGNREEIELCLSLCYPQVKIPV